ncbi:MAG: hypothetical protein ACRD2G_14620 [Terriglobia bacterium]
MATRKMTFTLPEDLATKFVGQVAARDRSRYLAEALAAKLAKRERRLTQACQIANNDPEVETIEKEFDSISGEIVEPQTRQTTSRLRHPAAESSP